jgi:protein-tyrosine phosphatase
MARTPAVLAFAITALLGAQAATAGTITEAAVVRTAPDQVAVSWTDRDPVEVYMAEASDAPIAKSKLVSAGDRDGRYTVSVGEARPYFLLVDKTGHSQVRVAERLIPLQQGSNFRDVGGYPAAGGKHVRWGMIYRSGGQPLLTDADVAHVQNLGIKDLVDLRSSEERVIAPTRLDGIRYSAVGYSMSKITGGTPKPQSSPGEAYRNFPTMLAPQIRIIFAKLLAKEGPLAYNCSAGQDRTGFATAMVLTALGVPRDVILADYHLSTTYRRPEWEMPKIDTATQANNPTAMYFARYQTPGTATPRPLYDANHQSFLLIAFDEVEKRYGSVDNYLQQVAGIGPAERARLRAIYLE